MHAAYDEILASLVPACRRHYGDNLLAVAVYGSVGRGMPRPDSDVDLLIVAEGLADRHALRVRRFRGVTDVGIERLAEVSTALRKERELAFCGAIDFIPTDEYTREHAEHAFEDATWVVSVAASVISPR